MAKSSEKHKKQGRQEVDQTPVSNDPRFSSVNYDPRFNIPRKRQNKTVVDERFKPLVEDADFARTSTVDRYGRKRKDDAERKAIKDLYSFEDDKDDDEEDDTGKHRELRIDNEVDISEEEEATAIYDPARGEGLVSSSEEETSDEEVNEDEEAELADAQKEEDDIPRGDTTSRIAVVNLDWDHVKSSDLMVTFCSFVPAGGKILNVSIYPSEFGKERMEREEMEGPPAELFNPVSSSKTKSTTLSRRDVDKDEDEDEEEDEALIAENLVKEDKGEEFDSARLRQYQLERLRYFYAIVECDSATTANAIYTECDGAEYEATANFFDLRFVPDGTTFDDHPRDACTDVPQNYKPLEFVTDALQHSKVKLTWDQEDQTRKQVAKEAFSRKDIEDMDLKAYLASSSESEGEEETERQRYRALLNLRDANGSSDLKKEKRPVGDMEVTFTSALSGDQDNGNVFEKEETTLEKYQRKEKERRQKRKDKHKHKQGEEDEHSDVEANNETTKNGISADKDTGFDDPFFEEDDVKTTKTMKKKDKQLRREEKAKEAAKQAENRAQLEVLMQNDAGLRNGDDLQHYDMKNIVRAEKVAKLKGKAAKRAGKKVEARSEGLQDNYEMDIGDPRLKPIYEDADFAIDPTNPRYKKTSAMEKVLKEKRRRRTDGDVAVSDEDRPKKKKKHSSNNTGSSGNLKSLVESLKNKSKRS